MKSIFLKTFFNSMFLTLAVICVAFLMIYLLMPRLYTGYKEELLEEDIEEVCKQAEGKSLNEVKRIAVRKADKKSYLLNIYDGNGESLVSYGVQTVTSFTVDTETADIEQEESEYEVKINVLSKDRIVRDLDNRELMVVFMTSLEPVDEARNVILRLLPIVLLISVLLTVGVSYIHAKRITGPIGNISKAVRKMKTLDRDASCTVGSGDEIGNLAENINELYGRLMKAIDDLQEEYDQKTAADKERVDLMLAVSHEIKTPLTSVRGMLECMQYNVGVYKDHETYLKECVDKVDEMTKLINDTLATSKLGLSDVGNAEEIDLKELFYEIKREYELIAMKRGVVIDTEDLSGKSISAPPDLFKKAVSNIVSNAVKYSDKGKNVRIYMSDEKLVVENSCTPLKKEEIESMFLPFVRKDGNEESGHGLGLYITDRILKVCGIGYSFVPFENGMRFVMDFTDED